MKRQRMALVASAALLLSVGVGSYARAQAESEGTPVGQPTQIGIVCRPSHTALTDPSATAVAGVKLAAAPAPGTENAVVCDPDDESAQILMGVPGVLVEPAAVPASGNSAEYIPGAATPASPAGAPAP